MNSLQLKDKNGNVLSLDETGNGSFKELVKSYVIASAQKALDKGTDLKDFTFLTIVNNKVTAVSFDAYLNYLGRQKTPPAFDGLDLSNPENMLFGTKTIDKKHFTDFSLKKSTLNASKADVSYYQNDESNVLRGTTKNKYI